MQTARFDFRLHAPNAIIPPPKSSPPSEASRKRKLEETLSSGGGQKSVDGNKRIASMERVHTTQSSSLGDSTGIDTDLYSRQIGAFGLETMGKLIKLRILISGLNGCGVETAKNLILAGPNAVSLHDDKIVSICDLGSNFYLSEDDVKEGRSRSQACTPRLAKLNDYVTTAQVTGKLTPELLGQYNVVIVSEMKISEMIEINNFCRNNNPPIGFIAIFVSGLSSAIFLDYGLDFVIFDRNGNPPKTAIIEAITQDEQGTVHLYQEKKFPFSKGDFVTFKEVSGMEKKNGTTINDEDPIEIIDTGKYQITLNYDTRQFDVPYIRNGIVEEKKMPYKISFQSFKDSIEYPIPSGEYCLINMDLGKIGRPEQLCLAYLSVFRYMEKYNQTPPNRCPIAIQECLNMCREINNEAITLNSDRDIYNQPGRVIVEELDDNIISNIIKFWNCFISPIASFVGGIVAQEVVKFTGKFTPLRQWLFYDAFEALNKDEPTDTATTGSRYDDQIIIWGHKFQEELGKMKIFLVGAGALGCEFMKSFAMLGCCNKSMGGSLTITDMDRIEVSNLNRQFLFYREHVGKSKSKVAAIMAKGMNPDLNVNALELRVGPETENIFSAKFWESLNVVVNALDNIQSRQYIDGRCVWYEKPLLESGTLGTRGNVQVVLPHMTQCYSDSHDPPEDSIPLCTLKHFPNQIEHTIEWARDAFQGLFYTGPQEACKFLENPEDYLSKLENEGTAATQQIRLKKIRDYLLTANLKFNKSSNMMMEICVDFAVKLFTTYFHYDIAQLLHSFPPDHVTATGQLFWSGPKRRPDTILFDIDDPLHMEFIISTANLYASILNIPQNRDLLTIRNIAAKIQTPTFVPQKLSYRIENDKDVIIEGLGGGDDFIINKQLQNELMDLVTQAHNYVIQSIEFEKDDDQNFHIDFITSCANLRARNYKIPECERHKAKMIAGKIVPAIATTTAMITGLVSLELYKIINFKQRPLSDFKNAFVDLATQFYIMTEPAVPLMTTSKEYDSLIGGPVRAIPEKFSKNPTLEELMNAIKIKSQETKFDITIVSYGNICLYNGYLSSHKNRLSRCILELLESITKNKFQKNEDIWLAFEVSCTDEEGIDIVIPTIKLQIVQ